MKLDVPEKDLHRWRTFQYTPDKNYIAPGVTTCQQCNKNKTPPYKKICVVCKKEIERKWNSEYRKRYAKTERGKETAKRSRIKNRERINAWMRAYIKKRRATDVNFRLSCNLRMLLYSAFKRHRVPKSKILTKYGIDLPAILKKLGAPPTKEHTIDHIIPCATFDFSKDDEVRKCFSPENLQWLTQSENSAKSSFMVIDGKRIKVRYKRGVENESKKTGNENNIPKPPNL